MSYKPNYDDITKGYNDALNILSGGNFTPVKRKNDTAPYGGMNQPKSTFEQWNIEKTQPKRNTANNVGYGGGANIGWKWNPYPATANVDKSTDRGYNKVAEWDRPSYGDWDKSRTVTPRLSYNSAGAKEDKPASIYDTIHSDMKRYETQTPSYRPDEGGIKKPEKLFLSADEKKNLKFEQLPYKPNEHKGEEYKLYSNKPNGFGELKLASNDISADQGEKTKWTAKFVDWIQNIFKEQQKAKMINYQLTDNAQKNMQRNVWSFGAQHYLREQKGYLTSAWMLEHSLQDNPEDIYRGNDSRIAYLINHDDVYLSKLDEAIRNSKNGEIDTDLKDIRFSNGDLYYSIHKADIHVKGYKQENGKWIIKATMSDIYNFDTIQTFMDDGGGWSTQAGLGTVANDVALGSQILGAINPYNVTVEFYTTR